MKKMFKLSGKLTAFLFCLSFSCNCSFAYTNNLREVFANNEAILYSINIRTFGAKDSNGNDIIETELGEESGTFINAIPKLKTLKENGINTVYLMPVTPVGKRNAKGTAGSLYAMDAFDMLNPQFLDKNYPEKDIKTQAKKFIEEAHKLGLYVIADLPSCGSYDFLKRRPELFLRDDRNIPISPSNWFDVVAFAIYNPEGTAYNKYLYDEHIKFFDMLIDLNFDGVRVDSAASKSYEFWSDIVNHVRSKRPDFFLLAEASPEWEAPFIVKGKSAYLNVDQLLEIGFDGFYQDWQDFTVMRSKKLFKDIVTDDMKVINRHKNVSIVGTFATHDQKAPIYYGASMWHIINWLTFVLPMNPYILDGFPAADNYTYKFWESKPDPVKYKDCKAYASRPGIIDLYNYSRAPHFFDSKIYTPDFKNAVKFREKYNDIITSKNIKFLKTTNNEVFAFERTNKKKRIIVVGNMSPSNTVAVKVFVPRLNKNDNITQVTGNKSFTIDKNKLSFELKRSEIQVLVLDYKPTLFDKITLKIKSLIKSF